MMQIIHILLDILEVALGWYMLLPTALLLIYGVKKLFRLSSSPLKNKKPVTAKQFDIAAIIPAHTDLTLVPPLVDSLLKQTYTNFHIYVIADNCKEVNLHYDDPRIKILVPEVPFNNKTKSIDMALDNFVEPHEVFVIFDSDNLVHPKYMEVLNAYFDRGFRAVQTHMLPKNTDSLFARMDAAGNHYCNFLDRMARMELGLSANIWGLGIAIETQLYKDILYENFPGTFRALGGFDKRMQAEIVKQIPQLAYAEEAVVYDEKIENGPALQKQRTRWISAYFTGVPDALKVIWTGIRTFSFDRIYFGVNLLRPPLFIMLLTALFLVVFNFWFEPAWAVFWAGAIVLFVLTFFTIVTVMSKDAGIFKAMFFLPLFMWRQVKGLLHLHDAGKDFLRTQNTKVVYIEEMLGKQKG